MSWLIEEQSCMASDRITLTRAGFEQLERELRMLEEMQRQETAEVADAFDDMILVTMPCFTIWCLTKIALWPMLRKSRAP